MQVEKGRYEHMDIEGFSLDEFFVESMLRPTPASEIFWQQWLSSNPDKQALWTEAATLVKALRFESVTPKADTEDKIWAKILDQTKQQPAQVVVLQRNRWIWAAAMVAGLITLGILGSLWWSKQNKEIQTQFAEIKTIELPDHSIVTLNANSSLTFHPSWQKGKVREVWLQGEGFFEVNHLHQKGTAIQSGDRFIVHAGGLDIEVLGTSFNVQDRKGKTEVVLATGKVMVSVNTPTGAKMEMKPGEKVKFELMDRQVRKEQAILDKDLSWRKNEIYLNTTTVAEIISIIENHYGYEVQVQDKSILSRKISGTGSVSLEKEQTFFKLLEITLNIRIEKKEKTLILMNR